MSEKMMPGQMMKEPLLISSLIEHADRYHGQTEIISVETTGDVVTTNWHNIAKESKALAASLEDLGIKQSQRCATIAWNNYRHLEIYFAVSGAGMVCHTINPRLSPKQLIYVINHAEDQVLFIDATFVPLIEKIKDKLKSVKYFVLMGKRDQTAIDTILDILFMDELIEKGNCEYQWPQFDENTASSLCYTSGTTGNPKGVLYSHRSTILHSFAISLPDSLSFSALDTGLPVVPMFHVNAWGVPYAAAMCGVRLVFPGPNLDGDSLVKLIDKYQITSALGVPTIWQGLLAAAKKNNSKLSSLKRTVVGGATCPPEMITEFHDVYGVEVTHAWGMTELSPLGTANQLLAKHSNLTEKEKSKIRQSQGRPPYGIQLEIFDDDGTPIKNDGESQGNLFAKGYWVVDSYFKSDSRSQADSDSKAQDKLSSWFDTGDIATIDADGFMSIKDRSKDIIKSGGEWISSVNLELIAASHPAILESAAIGAAHEKWGERPVIIAVKNGDDEIDEETLLKWFEDKVIKWQIPSAVIFVKSLPRNATGKILKIELREEFGNVLMDS